MTGVRYGIPAAPLGVGKTLATLSLLVSFVSSVPLSPYHSTHSSHLDLYTHDDVHISTLCSHFCSLAEDTPLQHHPMGSSIRLAINDFCRDKHTTITFRAFCALMDIANGMAGEGETSIYVKGKGGGALECLPVRNLVLNTCIQEGSRIVNDGEWGIENTYID